MQWVGIFCVCAGLAGDALVSMALTEPGVSERGEVGASSFGMYAVLAGSLLHSLMFCMCESLLTASIPASVVCSTMGSGESIILALYHVYLLGPGSSSRFEAAGRSDCYLLLTYALLVVVCALHAAAFFSILGSMGATSSGVLKGLQV
eukprot:CAMPEP_0185749796 /NCGR_PEP_ID=MMETSP1174-20130828/8508_1 /TAXON_ID=35687 /ORGANISM="Dictyocha speculum, Strain CCMP1381" /LENGTH=147 /DNA_ID=CAMNT_0028426069 /DNA_START=494 /DNA_END=937 /DNA_ORIENTATION=-